MGFDIGDIRDPNRIGRIQIEVLLQLVLGNNGKRTANNAWAAPIDDLRFNLCGLCKAVASRL